MTLADVARRVSPCKYLQHREDGFGMSNTVRHLWITKTNRAAQQQHIACKTVSVNTVVLEDGGETDVKKSNNKLIRLFFFCQVIGHKTKNCFRGF